MATPPPRAIVVEEGHTDGDWTDAAPLHQVALLLHHLETEAALPSKSLIAVSIVSSPLRELCQPRTSLDLSIMVRARSKPGLG
jgi:hypothetical protein